MTRGLRWASRRGGDFYIGTQDISEFEAVLVECGETKNLRVEHEGFGERIWRKRPHIVRASINLFPHLL